MADGRELRLSGNASLVRRSFDEWHRVLVEGSERVGSAMRIVGTNVRFRRIGRHREKRHLDFWIGSSDASAVQLNQPGTAGSENPGTTLAVDGLGRRSIVRQGMLTGNPPSDRIDEVEFRRRTGLFPSTVRVGSRPARKEWHVVARLDGRSPGAIRRDTAESVRLCRNARVFGLQAADDRDRLGELFGPGERGGWYDIDPTLLPRRALRVQGYVYEQLEALLAAEGIAIGKPRHAANYEVDGTVATPAGPVLVEIKTGVSAADVYCGVGQLTLYPVVLPDLAGHARLLLLPGEPTVHLVQALGRCGVELHRYALTRGRRKARAVFSAAFLSRCGMSPARVAGARRRARGRRRGSGVTVRRERLGSAATTADADADAIPLPPSVGGLVRAHRRLVREYAATSLSFTLDGRLVGDLAEATAAAAFGLELCRVRTPGVDAHAPDGRSVQVKASGIGKGPAFTPGEGRAAHLLFLLLNFDLALALVRYNGPEAPVRASLAEGFAGTRRVHLSTVLALDAAVAPEHRLRRVR